MGNISKHLSRHEMTCGCGCGFSACDKELVEVIEECIDHFEQQIGHRLYLEVTGPNRCESKNRQTVGAVHNSPHILGLAMDFRIKSIHEDEVASYLIAKYPDKYGVGRYNRRTHLDVKPGLARRWDYR